MTLFAFGRLRSLRDGRYAEPATTVAWLAGLALVFGTWLEATTPVALADVTVLAGPLVALAAAGGVLGLVSRSVARASTTGAGFGLSVVLAWGAWVVVAGGGPFLVGADGPVLATAALALAVPVAVATTVRAVG